MNEGRHVAHTQNAPTQNNRLSTATPCPWSPFTAVHKSVDDDRNVALSCGIPLWRLLYRMERSPEGLLSRPSGTGRLSGYWYCATQLWGQRTISYRNKLISGLLGILCHRTERATGTTVCTHNSQSSVPVLAQFFFSACVIESCDVGKLEAFALQGKIPT